MKFLVILGGVVLVLGGFVAAVVYVPGVSDKVPYLSEVKEMIREIEKDVKHSAAGEDGVVLYLKNGSSISGILEQEKENSVVVYWQGGLVEFELHEIEKIERGGKPVKGDGIALKAVEVKKLWEYRNSPVVVLNNGQVMDSPIVDVGEEYVVIKIEFDGGGFAENEIPRENIHEIKFKPIVNKGSHKKREELKKLFPKMNFHENGMFTLITDSGGASLSAFKRTVREASRDIYLEYFDLLKTRKPNFQHYMVIFDDYFEFFDYSVSRGVPAWAVLGYFSPSDKVLYCYNALGERFEDFMYAALIGIPSLALNAQADQIKQQIDKHLGAVVDGQVKDIMRPLHNLHVYLKGLSRHETLSTLRHEMVHEMLSHWGVQNVKMSNVASGLESLIKQKKDQLMSGNAQDKKEFIMGLLTGSDKENPFTIEASNSWFVEGMAAYSETSPIGIVNHDWLYYVQEDRKNNQLYPLEHLMVYKNGSFPGVADIAQASTYSQSWSFVHFLMKNYRKQFFAYLEKLTQEKPDKNQEVDWFVEIIGKDLRTLEAEWYDHVGMFEQIEDPQVEQFVKMQEILTTTF